nr:hypothetical protein [Tanacetum cinerariifolium]
MVAERFVLRKLSATHAEFVFHRNYRAVRAVEPLAGGCLPTAARAGRVSPAARKARGLTPRPHPALRRALPVFYPRHAQGALPAPAGHEPASGAA